MKLTILQYERYYFKDYHLDDMIITDDPIVQIVPKELFFIQGEHLYMGKEYGFFVNTVKTIDGDSYADVLVFDIYGRRPSFPSHTTGSIRLTPLFCYRYRTVDNVHGGAYDPSLTSVVYTHTLYDAPEYFLDDIGFKISLSNPDLPNPGDTNYVALNDAGAFIIQTRYNVRGVGLKKKNKSFDQDTVKFAFGFVPYIGTIMNVGEYIYGVHDGFGNQGYAYSRETLISDNEINIHTYETNNIDQINVRGNLIKSVSAKLVPNANSPRIIHVKDGYAEMQFVIARKSGSQYNNLSAVLSVSTNVLMDNTSRHWFSGGTNPAACTITVGWSERINFGK